MTGEAQSGEAKWDVEREKGGESEANNIKKKPCNKNPIINGVLNCVNFMCIWRH